jgi:DNA/RNA endonuclease YhcR with UshA esterase domain
MKLVAGFLLAFLATPAFPHHSFAAEFDINKPVTVTGILTKVEWTNPHVFLYVETKDETGKVETWQFEMDSPNGMLRRGWNKTSLRVGESITVSGYAAKDGSRTGNARVIK